MTTKPKPLNGRYLRFADDILRGVEPGPAYLNAGFGCKPQNARKCASKLKQRDDIKEYLASERAKIAEHVGITASMILREYKRIAFTPITDVVELDKHGSVVGFKVKFDKDGNAKLSDAAAASLSTIEKRFDRDGNEIIKVRQHSKTDALGQLCKQLDVCLVNQEQEEGDLIFNINLNDDAGGGENEEE